jgi:hypothetical protein
MLVLCLRRQEKNGQQRQSTLHQDSAMASSRIARRDVILGHDGILFINENWNRRQQSRLVHHQGYLPPLTRAQVSRLVESQPTPSALRTPFAPIPAVHHGVASTSRILVEDLPPAYEECPKYEDCVK